MLSPGFNSTHGFDQARRKVFGVGEEIGDFGEVVMGHGLERRGGEVQGREVAGEGVEEFGDAEVADLLEDAALAKRRWSEGVVEWWSDGVMGRWEGSSDQRSRTPDSESGLPLSFQETRTN